MFGLPIPGPVVRGCGTRVLGGIYAETLLGPNGHPIECFIKDPPIPVDCEALGLSSVGVKIIEQNGIHYIFDIVGKQHYQKVSDFIEEVRRFGVSRRLPPSLPWEKLTGQTRLVLIHSEAIIENAEEWVDEASDWDWQPQQCPAEIRRKHDNTKWFGHVGASQCAAWWWVDHNMTGTSPGATIPVAMPSFSYMAMQKNRDLINTYRHGIFLSVPIHRLAVINDPQKGEHEKHYETLSARSGEIPVELVDE